EPYADIGGPGVLAGFLGTAWLVVLLVVLGYFASFDPKKNPFASADKSSSSSSEGPANVEQHRAWRPNRVDQLVISQVDRLSSMYLGRFARAAGRLRWEIAFRKVILSMCDVQLVTGFGILISAYKDLLSDSISAYHWQIVVYLSWFSNLTHIACLVTLRGYLHHHQRERNWRLVFMAILWLLLIPAMVPTTYFNWAHYEPTAALPASNARCFFDLSTAGHLYYEGFNATFFIRPSMPLSETSALQSAVVSILLLILSFGTRCMKLTKKTSELIRLNIRQKTSQFFKKALEVSKKKVDKTVDRTDRAGATVVLRLVMAVYFTGKLYTDLLTSDISDVYWLLVSALWGTIRLSQARSSAIVAEDEWAFGQTLSVLLLLGPIVATIVALFPDTEPGKLPNIELESIRIGNQVSL
ncbi:hypothetical protein B0T22DRAFT_355898, partial [Podospora appendiculata]